MCQVEAGGSSGKLSKAERRAAALVPTFVAFLSC
jgi:hypothetical protein